MISDNECDSNSWDPNGPSSLDLWDYTMELECLKGNEGNVDNLWLEITVTSFCYN